MGRVLVTRPLPEGGTDPLTDAGHEIVTPPPGIGLAELAGDVDGIVVQSQRLGPQ